MLSCGLIFHDLSKQPMCFRRKVLSEALQINLEVYLLSPKDSNNFLSISGTKETEDNAKIAQLICTVPP